MREILFRGKRKEDKEWVEGFYAKTERKHYIVVPISETLVDWHEVNPATIGQYTGVCDKNGKPIFEGDLVEAVLPQTTAQMGFVWPIMPVVFSDGVFGLQDQRGGVTPFKAFAPRITFEVKGNVHDNPELLKGDADA